MDNTLHDLISQLGELRAIKKKLEYEARQTGELIAIK